MGVAGRRRGPAPLPPAGRLGLGRRALAGLQHRPRPLGHRQLRGRAAARVRPDSADARPTRPRRRRRPSTRRSRSGWTRTSRRRPARGCSRSRATSSRPPTTRAPRSGSASSARSSAPSARPPCVISSPSLPITRPADARSHDLLLRLHRLLPLRAAAPGGAATAGRGLRAIEPGMPLPAGTGLSRRSFVTRTAGLALAVFGGAALSPARVRRRHRGRAGRRPGPDPRLDLLRRRAGLAVAARAGRRLALRVAARLAGAARRPLVRVRGRLAAALAPAAPRRCATSTPPASSPSSRRSATTTRTSRTSPRATTGRSARPTRPGGSAGSAATWTATAPPTTRCRACRSTTRWRPALATGERAGRRGLGPTSYDVWTRDLWDSPMANALITRWGGQGALATADPELARSPAARPSRASPSAPQLSPLQGWQADGRLPGRRAPVPRRGSRRWPR